MPLLEADRRKEMKQERLHAAGNAGAGPEVVTKYWSVTNEGERWRHNPGRRRVWSAPARCVLLLH